MTLYAGEVLAALALIAAIGAVSLAGYSAGQRKRQAHLERTRAPLRAAGAHSVATAVYAGGLPNLPPQAVELFTDGRTLWLVPIHTADDARPVALAEVTGLDVHEHLRIDSQLDLPASYAFGGAGYRITSQRLGAVVVRLSPRSTGGPQPVGPGSHGYQVELGAAGIEGARQLNAALASLANAAAHWNGDARPAAVDPPNGCVSRAAAAARRRDDSVRPVRGGATLMSVR
jgi:hypothetical protein